MIAMRAQAFQPKKAEVDLRMRMRNKKGEEGRRR
jgi:hypothetical protein